MIQGFKDCWMYLWRSGYTSKMGLAAGELFEVFWGYIVIISYIVFLDPYEMVLGSMVLETSSGGFWQSWEGSLERLQLCRREQKRLWVHTGHVHGHSLSFFEKHESVPYHLDIGLFRHLFLFQHWHPFGLSRPPSCCSSSIGWWRLSWWRWGPKVQRFAASCLQSSSSNVANGEMSV